MHDPSGALEAIGDLSPIDTYGIAGELTGSAAIVFRLVSGRGRLDVSLAQRAFGLTEAEADVIAMIVRGLSIKQISGARRSKENTVRTILKRAMAKVGTSRQAELTAALSAMIFPE